VADDFKSEKEAFVCAEELITQNGRDFEFEYAKIDHPIAKLVKYKYVIGHGTKRSYTSSDHTSITGSYEPKTKKGLEDIGGAWAALADGTESQPSTVKVESPVFEELKKTVEATRSEHLYILYMYISKYIYICFVLKDMQLLRPELGFCFSGF